MNHLLCILLLVMVIQCIPLSTPLQPGTAQAAADDAGLRNTRNSMLMERQKSLVLRSLDDLRWLLALADRTEAELEKEVDAITPLEPSVREQDVRSLMDVFDRYEEWLKEQQAHYDEDLALLSSGQPAPDDVWAQRFDATAETFTAFDRQLSDMAARFDEEGKRLAGIIDRRRLLQDTLADLEAQLAGLKRKQDRRSAKKPASKDHEQLRTRIGNMQNELLTLPLLDEVILKHYANVGERARSEAEWMQAKAEEYRLLGDITQMIMAPGTGNAMSIEAARNRVQRVYDRVIVRMQKRIDTIDRKLSRLTPAGSLHDLQRSAELGDLYREQRLRYGDYIGRLKVQAGALEAELSELPVR